jgi:hypothetical protein
MDPGELWCQTQIELDQWSCLLNATGEALKPEKCFWYLLDYECFDGEWTYADEMTMELRIMNPDGTKSPIKQEKVTESKKTLGIYDSLSGGNKGHLSFIVNKATQWVNRIKNGYLPSHVAWIVYKHQLWPSLRYGLGTMTNDMEVADKLLNNPDYKTLNILGIFHNVSTGLQKLHTTFSGLRLFSLPTKQLISQVNMLFQHYHVSTNLSQKLDASLRYLQLQLGTLQNLLMLDFTKWGHLAPLSWVKMLWKSLYHFNIQLYTSFPMIPNPREQDQVIMDIFFLQDLGSDNIKSVNRCRGAMKAIFLSDLSTADSKYLKHFVFNPGLATAGSTYIFPRKKPTRADWDTWVNFWHSYTTTGGKLKMPLGNWCNTTHHVWQWYYTKEDDDLQQIEGGRVVYFKPARRFRLTRSTVTY